MIGRSVQWRRFQIPRTHWSHRKDVVQVEFRTEAAAETCTGIVLKTRPLVILVPQHAVTLLEDDDETEVLVDGVGFKQASILHDAHLAMDQVVLLSLGARESRERAKWSPTKRIPRRRPTVAPGDPLTITRVGGPPKAFQTDVTGIALSLSTDLDGESIVTNVSVVPGSSGSPICSRGKLYAITQGRVRGDNGDLIATGIPLTSQTLRSLRRTGRIWWRYVLVRAAVLLLLTALPFGVFAAISHGVYPITGLDISEDQTTVAVDRDAVFPATRSWTYLSPTYVFTSTAVAASSDGEPTMVAVGNGAGDDRNGSFVLLNSSGRIMWQYSVPPGECVYKDAEEASMDWFSATFVYPADLDLDGTNELIVAFSHMTWYPAKIMVFDLQGNILGEYWHHGYVRTIVSGLVGTDSVPLTVISASNNSLKTSWWNPQVLFAFHGLDIQGTGPEPEISEDEGSQIWYRVIMNIDPEVRRPKVTQLALVDQDGDGTKEIRVSLADGRFYYLNERGETVATAAGDFFLRDWGNIPLPPLLTLDQYLSSVYQNAAPNQ